MNRQTLNTHIYECWKVLRTIKISFQISDFWRGRLSTPTYHMCKTLFAECTDTTFLSLVEKPRNNTLNWCNVYRYYILILSGKKQHWSDAECTDAQILDRNVNQYVNNTVIFDRNYTSFYYFMNCMHVYSHMWIHFSCLNTWRS